MTIPSAYDVNLPLLKHITSGEEFYITEIVDALAKKFHLTDEELRQRHKSGDKIFHNNVRWSRAYLKSAGLLESPKRGCVRITQEGQKLLENPPTIINHSSLMEYSSYAERVTNKYNRDKDKSNQKEVDNSMVTVQDLTDKTPEESMSDAQRLQEKNVADEILERVHNVSPQGFEELILKLLDKMGYGFEEGSSRHLGGSGDGGVDGVIEQDALGLDRVYIQAKRYQEGASVGSPAIREFSGSLNEQRVQKGLFITSSAFSRTAVDAAGRLTQNIVLIDGEELVRLMIRYNVGVRVKTTYELKDVDEDFFEDL